MSFAAQILLVVALMLLVAGILIAIRLQFGPYPGRRIALSSVVAFVLAAVVISAAAVSAGGSREAGGAHIVLR